MFLTMPAVGNSLRSDCVGRGLSPSPPAPIPGCTACLLCTGCVQHAWQGLPAGAPTLSSCTLGGFVHSRGSAWWHRIDSLDVGLALFPECYLLLPGSDCLLRMGSGPLILAPADEGHLCTTVLGVVCIAHRHVSRVGSSQPRGALAAARSAGVMRGNGAGGFEQLFQL